MLPNMLQCIGQPPTAKNYLNQKGNNALSRNPGVRKLLLEFFSLSHINQRLLHLMGPISYCLKMLFSPWSWRDRKTKDTYHVLGVVHGITLGSFTYFVSFFNPHNNTIRYYHCFIDEEADINRSKWFVQTHTKNSRSGICSRDFPLHPRSYFLKIRSF